MSIQEIEQRIIEQAQAEAAKIKSEAEASANQLAASHARQKAERREQAARADQRQTAEAKRAILVPARLEGKKALLEEKQKILGGLYEEIGREKKLSAAELARLREETEVAAARILFAK